MPEPNLRTLDDLPDIAGSRVLVRVDFNVPVDDAGRITDDTRIRGALDTIRELTSRNARVVLASHRGRPKEWGDASLEPVSQRLAELLDEPVEFVDDVVGDKAQAAVRSLKPGQVLVLQNLRYEPGEKASDAIFAEKLASLADYYVDDAFGAAHRKDASVALVPGLLPGYAGRLLMRELHALSQLVDNAERPFWAVIGGSKVSDKVTLLSTLIEKVDGMAIGGGMANTFLAAKGLNMGASKVEDEAMESARDILASANRRGVQILLPDQVLAAKGFREDAPARVAVPGELEPDEMALDVAVESVDTMLDAMASARTVFWNGPLGVFEWERFKDGTMRMAQGLAQLEAHTVVGGGDSVAAVMESGNADRLSHVSTGGGAALELLEGKTLPGVAALENSPRG